MKTIHVMKTLNKALFAFLLIVPFVLVDVAPAVADATMGSAMVGEGTVKYGESGFYIEMPDGSTRPLPDSELFGIAINSALEAKEKREQQRGEIALAKMNAIITQNMRNAILANAPNDPIIAAIITSYIVSQVPIFAGPLTTGALLGAGAGAAPLILNTVANIPNVNFIQVVADVNNNPEIPPETKQTAQAQQVATTEPAAGGDQGGDTGDDLVTDGEETAENPAQTTETNPTP